MPDYIEVRCPFERPHEIRGVEYDYCGSLLGAISGPSETIFRCPTCGFVKIIYTDMDELTFYKMESTRIGLTKHWREVRDNE